MKLDRRLRLLEKKAPPEKLFAFIGLPRETEDAFEAAKIFWEENKDQHTLPCTVDGALPWPKYYGERPRFLGIGNTLDFWVGLGGAIQGKGGKFVFLREIEPLLRKHWDEALRLCNARIKNLDELPEGVQEVAEAFINGYTFGDL